MIARLFLLLGMLVAAQVAQAQPANIWRADALALEGIINANYAYPERLTGGRLTLNPQLRAEAERVDSEDALLLFAEHVLFLLADHHAITGSSFETSPAVVPSYADLWIERIDGVYRVTAVRADLAARGARLRPGIRLTHVDGAPIDQAVEAFWAHIDEDIGSDERASFAARILAAGPRNADRNLTFMDVEGRRFTIELPSRYALPGPTNPLSVETVTGPDGRTTTSVHVHDSLGDNALIPAFDAAMRAVSADQPLVIDLTETPSGGNTTVARAIMGWFTDDAAAYQIHRSPREERETGIPRQWIEQVLPRGNGMRHRGPLRVLVGRWTGSMGEGLAIGLAALGARVQGDRMAGLLGAIENIRLPNSGLIIKLPVERLMSVDGTPREAVVPHPIGADATP